MGGGEGNTRHMRCRSLKELEKNEDKIFSFSPPWKLEPGILD
jgi:hypothetical protein